MKQVKMLNKALKGGYVVPAFNFANVEILNGLIEACKETKSPVILQVSESAMDYIGDEILFGIISGIRKVKLPISIHLDHGENLKVVKRAIDLGFDSVMIDGSTLPFKKNVKLTSQVVKYAHAKGVSVEGELGVMSVANDDEVLSDGERWTNPIQAKEFVELTGVDSLAISIGTNHGINKYSKNPEIRYDILKEIEKQIPKTPLVLHGASLIEKQYIDTINKNGGKIKKAIGNENLLQDIACTNICKINMDTDFRLAYTAAVRENLKLNPDKYCPRTYGKAGLNAVKICAEHRIINICKSNNKA